MSFRLCRIVCLLAFTAILAGGCKEDPVGNEGTPPDPPRQLQVGLGATAQPRVILSWIPPADSTGITGYRIWWKKNGAAGSDSMEVNGAARSVQIIVEKDAPYTFSAAARRDARISSAATIEWGGWLPLQPVSALRASFSDSVTAALQWTPSPDTNVAGYLVAWHDIAANLVRDTVVEGRQTSSFSISGVSNRRTYLFVVNGRQGERLSAPVTAELKGLPPVEELPAPAPPEGLEASSLGTTSVALRWKEAKDTGAITYKVNWSDAGGGTGHSGSIDFPFATSTATVAGLTAGRSYQFSVRSVRGGKESSPVSVVWAPAARYTGQAGNPSEAIRIYETASSNGAGLLIDPDKGGPKTVGVGSSNPSPENVQLAIYTTSSDPSSFEIGPAYAFTEYRNADRFDKNVYVSQNSYVAASLSEWFFSSSITVPSDGNLRAFKFPATETGTSGQGFLVRTGAAGNYHFARVFITKGTGGRLLQGTSPDRYVELEISYQSVANLPFAKSAGRKENPVGQTSYVRR